MMNAAAYKTEIVIWSRTGSTPITKRGGAFCDELLRTEVRCADPAEAEAETKVLIAATPHGSYAHFHMPTYPNQNTRSGFVGSSW